MKKFLATVVILLMTSSVWAAAGRGELRNTYASWFTVTIDQTTVNMPFSDERNSIRFGSRDIFVRNGDSSALLCVDLRGGTIPGDCFTNDSEDGGTPSIIMIEPLGFIDLEDYVTNAIGLKTQGPVASPVTVIFTY